MPKKVLVFTKKVLPRSNTFVAAQSLNLPTIEPIFIGFEHDESGIDLIQGSKTCLLSNFTQHPKISKLIMELTYKVPEDWTSALKSKNAHIVHAHFGKGGFYCSAISKALDLPLITTFHGSDITQRDKFSYRQKHREIAFKSSGKILAVSDFIKNKLIHRGCPEDKIIRHYTGIDNSYFHSTGSKSEDPCILFVGRLIEQKGCHYLIQAMKDIQEKLPETKLLIAGYGNYQKKLEAMASSVNNIYFLGAQNKQQIRALMDKAWVTCLPSIIIKRGNEEGLSTVCMESQSMGTPIVGFDTGGVSEVVDNEQTGILVPQKDIRQLSDSLLEVLLNNKLRRNFSIEGINRVERLFNIKTQCKSLENIYYDIT